MTTKTIWCDCQCRRVERDRCDGCDPAWVSENDYEDPPLYPAGKLAGMSLAQLEIEHGRQCDRQGRLGDAERIDDRALEETEMRCSLVEAEMKRRKGGTA